MTLREGSSILLSDVSGIVGFFQEKGTIFSIFPYYFIPIKENRLLAFFYSSLLMKHCGENKVKTI
jgi:hypothetical protein